MTQWDDKILTTVSESTIVNARRYEPCEASDTEWGEFICCSATTGYKHNMTDMFQLTSFISILISHLLFQQPTFQYSVWVWLGSNYYSQHRRQRRFSAGYMAFLIPNPHKLKLQNQSQQDLIPVLTTETPCTENQLHPVLTQALIAVTKSYPKIKQSEQLQHGKTKWHTLFRKLACATMHIKCKAKKNNFWLFTILVQDWHIICTSTCKFREVEV